jgi:hypothetical protein
VTGEGGVASTLFGHEIQIGDRLAGWKRDYSYPERGLLIKSVLSSPIFSLSSLCLKEVSPKLIGFQEDSYEKARTITI